MNEIRLFNFEDNEVRAINKEGEAWFVASDVCRSLEISNVSQAVSRLESDEKDDIILNDVAGRERKTIVINESGLYELILTSRKPVAKPFKHWVKREVLPSIRKTGGYEAKPMSSLEMVIASAQAMMKLEQKQTEQDTRISLLEDAKDHMDNIFHLGDYTTVKIYCKMSHIKVTTKQSSKVGKKCSALCRERRIKIGQSPDPTYGTVNNYPVWVIEEFLDFIPDAKVLLRLNSAR